MKVAAGVNDEVAENTGIAPMPRWKEGGVSRTDIWLDNPTPDGHHLFANADNTPGGRRLLEWMYAEDLDRIATLYDAEPTRFVPNFSDVLGSDAFGSIQHFQDNPRHLEHLKFVQNEIVQNYYGQVEAANVDMPEWLYYARFFFIGEMVNQVVAADRDPAEADAKEKARQRLEEGKEKLR